VYRDWRDEISTDLRDAYKVRESLNADHVRQAEVENSERERRAAETDAQLAPLTRRLERQHRRAEMVAALDDSIPFGDERYRDWEARADELGAALFATSAPTAEPDTRSPLERIKAKEAGQ